MHVRKIESADLPMIRDWAAARDVTLMPELLSPYGFLCEDEQGPCGVLWAYLLYNVPVAMIDNQFTRPGLPGRRALRSWERLFDAVKAFLRELKDLDGNPMGYRVIRAFCLPEMIPIAKRGGWHVSPGQYNQTFYIL